MIAPQAAGAAPHLLAVDLAAGYERYVTACWRGEATAAQFGRRLGGYWRRELPPQPAGAPDAVSIHGSAGRGIVWYAAPGAVLGYTPGEAGGLAVPEAEVPPLVSSLPAAPWE